jgi:ketosteroid isomerase-like protein
MVVSARAQSNADLIGPYLDAVIRRDFSVVDRYFDANVEYMVNGTPEADPAGALPPISAECHAALPWLGLYHGREALFERSRSVVKFILDQRRVRAVLSASYQHEKRCRRY